MGKLSNFAQKTIGLVGNIILAGRLSGFRTQNGHFKVKVILSRGKPYAGRVRDVPRLSVLYHGICLTTEETGRKKLSRGSGKVPAGHDSMCQNGGFCG